MRWMIAMALLAVGGCGSFEFRLAPDPEAPGNAASSAQIPDPWNTSLPFEPVGPGPDAPMHDEAAALSLDPVFDGD
ncbi:MAG TPA: hypothetical protein VH475_14595 [Tepidisphaeraceae bacterium]|jgi:hypothetical protein